MLCTQWHFNFKCAIEGALHMWIVLQASSSRSTLELVLPIVWICSTQTRLSHVCCASPLANRKCCHTPVPLPCCTNIISAQLEQGSSTSVSFCLYSTLFINMDSSSSFKYLACSSPYVMYQYTISSGSSNLSTRSCFKTPVVPGAWLAKLPHLSALKR